MFNHKFVGHIVFGLDTMSLLRTRSLKDMNRRDATDTKD